MNDFDGLIIIEGAPETRGRRRTHHKDRPATNAEYVARHRGKRKAEKLTNIAVLDMETDPFDKEKQEKIFPFVACLYSDNFEPIVIWEEDHAKFVDEVLAAIMSLPEEYTIYAHNGGKFDWMFLVHKLRGNVSFKGRGIMSAKIGPHTIRDSFHIIPEKLANYQKEAFDYENMRKGKRNKKNIRKQIIDYLISDCKYLLEIVKGFLDTFGMRLSIGQAAMAELRKTYKVGTIGENVDANLRPFFYGGRVECLAGRGRFVGDFKLYDVNSMYPDAMANFKHPISSNYTKRRKGGINPNTVFIELECTNRGALVGRNEEGATTALIRRGRFFTTIHEFNMALQLDLISNIKILNYIDNETLSDFSDFVIPLYEKRQETKRLLKALKEGTPEHSETKREDIFTKLLLNNAYGKFAQNPRRFKETFITGPHDPPPEGFENPVPAYECEDYAIWQRPSPRKRFNNVGTAASITGAARSTLMFAIANAENPIYCDTDSLICTNLSNVEIHPQNLGAWDIEAEFSEVIVLGKKLYACRVAGQEDKFKLRSKGVSGLQWADYETMLSGDSVDTINFAPTLTRTGAQIYMTRKVRATAPIIERKAA